MYSIFGISCLNYALEKNVAKLSPLKVIVICCCPPGEICLVCQPRLIQVK